MGRSRSSSSSTISSGAFSSSSSSSMMIESTGIVGVNSEYRRYERSDGRTIRIYEQYRRPRISTPRKSKISLPDGIFPEVHSVQRLSSTQRDQVVREEDRIAKEMHVTKVPQLSRLRRKVVVHQKSVKEELDGAMLRKDRFQSRAEESTSLPPPTPNIGRLATPDLPEIVEFPFCECCDQMATMVCQRCAFEMCLAE
ncbi:hypothetical protein M501DRAFT_1000045 [Patellaria atrata CBS 101060]|uniref:Uncharacterized protein n=1 Tax=Patellaria atrata CBS 101060 TaxID=1346257 RepID=A0A9P4VIY8_9PEZI|nr:hypothetical protein M501DRAFT_1000045 [Patellaria atrata CBS 101060]